MAGELRFKLLIINCLFGCFLDFLGVVVAGFSSGFSDAYKISKEEAGRLHLYAGYCEFLPRYLRELSVL